ncbi:MAG: HAMP domain-containing histidine kinase [Propionibacteriaceae bacterium]|nr:HAMP domain-containing histidine kinase [Propionibacteriaceae bacterium]
MTRRAAAQGDTSPQAQPGQTEGLWTWRKLWQPALVVAALAAVLTVGWFAAEALFAVTGRPPALAAYLLAGLIGFLLLATVSFVFARATKRYRNPPEFLGEEIAAALDRIARGDFSVRLPPTTQGPLWELTASVNQMAEQLGTLEAQRQEFVSNVSHEIQSPLTSIGGFAELLRSPGLDEAKRLHYLDVIAAEVKRLSKLSDNLLRLTWLDRDDALTTHPYPLDEQLRGVVRTLEPQAAAKSVALSLDAQPVAVDADEDLLGQVWTNLVQNAVKFTGQGGHVSVSLDRDQAMARVRVADDGIGIAADELPHVFERFYRADKARSVGGNGL